MVGKFIKVCMKFCAPLGLLVYLPSDDTPWRSVGMFLLTFVGTLGTLGWTLHGTIT